MKQNARINVFISHSTKSDKSLAKTLKQWFDNAYNNLSVFVSSANGIRCGQCPSVALQNALQKADVLIAILSPEAMSNDWVIFEIGSMFGRGGTVFPILCRGGNIADAPRSVKMMYQIMNASDKDEFKAFIEDIDAAFGMLHKKAYTSIQCVLSGQQETATVKNQQEERHKSMQTIKQINNGNNNINNTGTITIIKQTRDRSRPAVPTCGVIGTSPLQRSYTKHLYDRLVYLKSKIPGYTPVRAGVTVARLVQKEFGATWTNIPIERYDDFITFLKTKIDSTPIGKKNSKAKIKNYSTEEEFLSRH